MKGSIGLFTYSTLPRGSVVHASYLAESLQSAGWDVTLYALDKGSGGFFRPLRAPVCSIPARPVVGSTAELVRLRALELAEFLETRKPRHDFFHAQDCLTASGLLLARERGRPLCVVRTVHHVESFADPYLAACQERSIRRAEHVLSVSRAARADVSAHFGVASELVSNGVDLQRFDSPDRVRVASWRSRLASTGPLFLSVGGVEARKNTVRMLRAFASFHRQHPGARWCLLGGASVLEHGAYRAEYERELARHPEALRAAVLELGVVADDEVPAIFSAADALLCASVHEGFGLVTLEALASRIPVLASRSAPFTEYLDDSCAVLVDPASDAELRVGIAQLLASGSERRALGYCRAERYSWARVAEQHGRHYERWLGRSLPKEAAGTEGTVRDGASML